MPRGGVCGADLPAAQGGEEVPVWGEAEPLLPHVVARREVLREFRIVHEILRHLRAHQVDGGLLHLGLLGGGNTG